MKEEKTGKVISRMVINRLPKYYRILGDLMGRGVVRISSRELADYMNGTASQIRQDLNCFGGFGQQGYGYNVETLHGEIGQILGVGVLTPAILVGAGNLGHTIANQVDLRTRGFRLVGAFDSDPEKVGQKLVGLSVRDISELEAFCAEHHPRAAVVCIPGPSAEELSARLIACGIVGFWNFSAFDFAKRYPGVAAVNVHLGDSVMTLSYLVKNRKEK